MFFLLTRIRRNLLIKGKKKKPLKKKPNCLSSARPLAFLSPIAAQWSPEGDPWPPPSDLQHQVTAGSHPQSLGHNCGPRDTPGILWACSCSPAQLQRIAVVGARRASHPASCGFRLPNLRCLQCPALGISMFMCLSKRRLSRDICFRGFISWDKRLGRLVRHLRYLQKGRGRLHATTCGQRRSLEPFPVPLLPMGASLTARQGWPSRGTGCGPERDGDPPCVALGLSYHMPLACPSLHIMGQPLVP